MRRALNRLFAFFRPAPLDAEFDSEILAHLENATADNIARGMSAEEARRQALIRFGGVAQANELHRETRGLPALDVLRQDLRFAFRTLRRDPSLASIVIAVLALGIGANVAVFSVVNTILLRPLPFHDPARLVWFASNEGKGGLSSQTYTVAVFEEFRSHNRSFEDVTSFQTFFSSIDYKLMSGGDPLPLTGVQVAENFFPLLGVQPAIGHQFTTEECRKGGRRAVLLSHEFWERQFAADPSIIGRTISIKADPADISGPVTVIGVLPASFDFGAVFSPGMHVDFFAPAYMDFWRTWGNTLAIVGRLRPGVSVAQAQAEAQVLFPQLHAMHANWFSDYKSLLSNLQDRVSGHLRRTLMVLWAAVGMMLLIVCINVSNLLLARTMSRSKEFAMRTALGAGRGRLIRQLLTESVLLSAAGTGLGLGIAFATVAYLARQTYIALPLLASARVDGAAFAFTALVAGCATAIFALAPAWRVAGGNLQDALKDGGQGISLGRRHERLRSALVVSEIALACVLLVGSGLLLRSFLHLLDVNLGFEPTLVAAMKVEIDQRAEHRGPMVQTLLDRVRALPGIDGAGTTDMLPLDRNRSWELAAKENRNDGKDHDAFVYVVSPGYLKTMGMRLIAGRDVSWQDSPDTAPAVVINEAAARREFPGMDPIGRTVVGMGRREGRVIGVVADVRESSLEDRASVQMYLPVAQFNPEGAELVVRTRLPLSTVEPAIFSAVRALNPNQPRTQFRPLQDVVDSGLLKPDCPTF
ncbi:MAG TPA: ABC transporter permease [Candidatus Limnocylindrales bacterium]|nr:ABC transporter permease [Candidatus Limnocylindrales bacterium]